ncbi:MAG TPA: 30S ribosome-binding factor RbfA [Rubricoccaceae bacterium]
MSIRTDRVARMIQREVADLLQQDFGEATQSLTTVTRARITPDLGTAYIDVSVMGSTEEARQAGFARLVAQAPLVRTALAARIRHQVRRIPEIKFFLDEGPQRMAHMDDLFSKIRAEREARGVDDAADDEGEDDAPLGRGEY